MKVLIADDDAVTRSILVRSLRDWGFRVVEAENGLEARALLDEDQGIRIAVLDWEMPGETGVNLCRRLLDRPRGSGVYTVLHTARNREEDLLFALQYGANAFLHKPASLPLLRAHLGVGRRLIEQEDRLVRYADQMEKLAEERARRLVEAERLATTDALTGALNRRGFLEAAEREFRRARRYRRPLTVLGIDADHFKAVNDSHGHHAGDQTLKALVATITDQLREGDLVGRVGGEEVNVMLPETDAELGVDVAERLRSAVGDLETVVDGAPIRVTVSVGVAALSARDESLTDVLVRADEALFEAKRGGRNRVCRQREVRTGTRFDARRRSPAGAMAGKVTEFPSPAADVVVR